MKRVVPLLLIIASLSGTQASAEHVVSQPLTRADCEKANLTWNDNANVCDVSFGKAGAKRDGGVTVVGTGQPLTRDDCDLAGMHWNDFANVCDVTFKDETTQSEAKATTNPPAASTILITIDKAAQKMTVSVDGEERYDWPVSTGLPRYSTPSGAFTARSMNKIWYSKEWDNAPMPHAIFFTREGHAIHGTNEVKKLGKPASHGCVRLSPQHASTLFTLVADKGLQSTQVVLSGRTPGRSVKTASPPTSRARQNRSTARTDKAAGSTRPGNGLGPSNDKSYARPNKQGGGLFRRLFKRKQAAE